MRQTHETDSMQDRKHDARSDIERRERGDRAPHGCGADRNGAVALMTISAAYIGWLVVFTMPFGFLIVLGMMTGRIKVVN